MNIGFGEPHAYTGGVVFDVCVDEDVIGTATNAGTPRRTIRLDVTDEWAIDEYLLGDIFDFKGRDVLLLRDQPPPRLVGGVPERGCYMPDRKRRRESESINEGVFGYLLGITVALGAVAGFVLSFVDGVVDFVVANAPYFGIRNRHVGGRGFHHGGGMVVRCGQAGEQVGCCGAWGSGLRAQPNRTCRPAIRHWSTTCIRAMPLVRALIGQWWAHGGLTSASAT